MMHIEAPHANSPPHKWLEWSLNPNGCNSDLAAWFGSVRGARACKGNELLTDEGCAVNGFDNSRRSISGRHPRHLPDGKQECVPYYGMDDELHRRDLADDNGLTSGRFATSRRFH